ncbi:D-lactate dehydrogenase [Acidocella aminolytica]|jgi:D-lactate dehydrogenase|uniref:Quinone-dependent D-lactate dehydrogenase n=1 Tax=Acidocella aminolytica 101 = DSM 11237 TaxID=1120923 RepID=A0A0D6PF11_9PROT|nr:D-lactate dehydrogenase [Acidocella aminolytica]GAN79951.1 D-lactate dehydrogenase [Acidocella aminolytica 101 = DSM 11237]GBQ38218.1 D-lactate dehydrogenase [Acidocella aminolytica 101 = DSM 11237]SHE58554.1 D-lactate dehydrogenase [Acidocella aminolytica 101 = DSM 11237]
MTNLTETLRGIVGQPHVLTGERETARFRKGFRFGDGPVLAVVQPGSLVDQWRVLKACHAAGVIIILQAANTGLTGGSTPDGADYDRPIVIISTLRLAKIHLIEDGRQVICLPGATLFQLEQALRPLGREPHSVIGSSCLGASVFGGIANNSGGSLIRRGPAFTQLTLYARVTEAGEIELVNHLGVQLGNEPEAMLAKLEAGTFTPAEIEHPAGRAASDPDYAQHVREIDAPTPARFNADPRRLHEAAGSAGKVMMFAVRLDSFPKDERTAVFYIGTNAPDELTQIRRHILGRFQSLPVAAEYIHRDAFNIAEIYGKDTFLAIERLGTDRLPQLFALKAKFDAAASRFGLPGQLSDRLMQWASRFFPQHLPRRMLDYRDRYEHHLLLKMSGDGIEEARAYLASLFPSAAGDVFECTAQEGTKAFLHRFAVAGAAVRYRTMHAREVSDIVALDIALRRDEQDWVEHLPQDVEAPLLHKLYYGHFFCHVFHQDYVVAKGHDPLAIEHKMWALLDGRGAEYPAEHNVGHLYHAKPALAAHYRALDPCNCFNPGIGKTSKLACWGEDAAA